MKSKTSKTLWIGKKAYMYLDDESRRQRGCKVFSKEAKDNLWKHLSTCESRFKNGRVQIDDKTFGGGDGTYYGKWWSWNVQTLKEMLDKAGFKYKEGKDIEFIEVKI